MTGLIMVVYEKIDFEALVRKEARCVNDNMHKSLMDPRGRQG